ncbi:E3 ubiquitin-protein ligase Praja-2 [Salminus brasiliensis]|uniref:E3 ubiquitin-protein ligase Praja-2 n=1 Tax=Salminus brasiliensis TaxID=930266 RepID=UPI003B82DFD8
MGQEAGKPSWPKPAGGYQSITGKRYGRRHAYVSFRPTPYKHRTLSSADCQEVEMSSVHGEHATALSTETISSMIPDSFPALSSNFAGQETKTSQDECNRATPSSRKTMDCEKWRSDHTHTTNSASAWAVKDEVDRKLASASVLSFVNIDSYEPDSSGGEEEGWSSEQTCVVQKRLDMICDLGKDFDDFGRSHACMCGDFCTFSDCLTKEMLSKPKQGDAHSKRTEQTSGKCDHQGKIQTDTESTYSGGPCSCIDPESSSMPGGVQSEMVVRPKVRKQTSKGHRNRTEHSKVEQESWTSAPKSVKRSCGPVPPSVLPHTTDFLFNFPPGECTVGKTELAESDSKLNIKDDDDDDDDDDGHDDDFWEDLEDLEEKCASPEKGEESSVYSEGEWSASWTSDSGLEKEQRSSEESWETLPGLDELPSSSSSLEDIPPLSLTQEEQTPLEDGEIPWLRCNEDSGSSSDENPESESQFVHPGLFIMDSSNNLEDDSSMSEDLDTEWRLLDDFEEGFGMAQAISYVDHPQLLTYMALEERLAQAMEAALAHLESLAIDVEQAHPPASEQIIDSLPNIIVLDDHRGQEQSCAICCCEYVNEEIATQLPCRHMFHKLCVTLWLRKSGTCPVCRHVLTHLNEPTPFLSNQENPSSSPSAAGQTR